MYDCKNWKDLLQTFHMGLYHHTHSSPVSEQKIEQRDCDEANAIEDGEELLQIT